MDTVFQVLEKSKVSQICAVYMISLCSSVHPSSWTLSYEHRLLIALCTFSALCSFSAHSANCLGHSNQQRGVSKCNNVTRRSGALLWPYWVPCHDHQLLMKDAVRNHLIIHISIIIIRFVLLWMCVDERIIFVMWGIMIRLWCPPIIQASMKVACLVSVFCYGHGYGLCLIEFNIIRNLTTYEYVSYSIFLFSS